MSIIFLNSKGKYLKVTEHSTRALPVHDYEWVDNINHAQVFNFSATSNFTSKRYFNGWRSGTPFSEIVGQARVEVVRTVTILEMRGIE